MLQYTYATLRAHLTGWVEGNGANASPEFLDDLDEIIQRGEARLYRDLNLATLDTTGTTAAAVSTAAVDKPDDLIDEELLILSSEDMPTTAINDRQLQKRSRAFVAAMNLAGATGIPSYYAEFSESQWTLAPIPDKAYNLTAHGMYLPPSITDGQTDASTTWLSTRVADVLCHACEIEAAARLKFWALKAAKETDYTGKLDDARAITENQRKANVGDIMGMRAAVRQGTGPDPAGTP